jgi:uncharacterized protein YjbI with pentapeptide repeats
VIVVTLVVSLAGAIIVLGYVHEWKWTGLVKGKAFSKRTLWDWLNLLIVPIVLALGGYLFTLSENRRTREDAAGQREIDRELADKRTNADRYIADQRRQDDALQGYFDHIGGLLLAKDKPLRMSDEGDEVRTLARARTLTVLRRLDSERKARVLQFLYEAELISKDGPIISLIGADLKGANLSGAVLDGANLRRVNLEGANLNEANLKRTNLSGARLEKANLAAASLKWASLASAHLEEANFEGALLDEAFLPRAHLRRAVLPNAHLAAANLSSAYLEEVNLEGAILARAKLDGADLSRARLEGANLAGAEGTTAEEVAQQTHFLKGATMPNGQKYEDWLKGREEGKGNSGPS